MPPALQTASEYFNPYVFRKFLEETPGNTDYIGFDLFPEEPNANDKIMYGTSEWVNTLAPFVAIGAESPIMQGEQISARWAETLYMRYKAAFNEHDMRLLREIGDGYDPNRPTAMGDMKAAAVARLARTVRRLAGARDGRLEWMQMKALTGGFSYTPVTGAGVEGTSMAQFTISYPVLSRDATTTGTGGSGYYWSDATNGKPVLDILNWFRDMPWKPAVMICARKVLYYLMLSQNVRDAMFNNVSRVPTQVTINQAQDYFQAATDLRVRTYDAIYHTRSFDGTKWTRTVQRFLPENLVVFLPSASPDIGRTYTAPSAYANWRQGKFEWAYDPIKNSDQIREPLMWEVGAGYYGLPVVERPDQVLVAQIAA